MSDENKGNLQRHKCYWCSSPLQHNTEEKTAICSPCYQKLNSAGFAEQGIFGKEEMTNTF